MNYRQDEVLSTHQDSNDWIFRHERYIKWLSEGCGLLWIKGKPGSGKSTLMKKIYKSIDENKSGEHVKLAFFFHRRGNALQQTPIGMFRTLLHQLLSQVPRFAGTFHDLWKQKKKWELESEQGWEWRFEELRDAFFSSLVAAAKSYRIIIFVDALDEAGNASREIVQYFHSLNKACLNTAVSTKICFSCRHFPIFAVKNAVQICLEDENQIDIENFAREELERTLDTIASESNPDEDVDNLTKLVTEKASGVFLWVTLMLPQVVKKYNAGESFNKIRETLKNAPANLGEVYKHILKNVIDAENHERTLRLMQWVYFAMRPLSVTEIRYAMVSDDTSMTASQHSCEKSDDFVENDARMERLVLSLSGGLAEVSNKTVQFIHQSVNDFFLKDGFAILDSNFDDDFFGKGNWLLSTSCINYFTQNDITSGLNQMFKKRTYTYNWSDEIERKLPFIEYSIKFMLRHAAEAEKERISNRNVLERFEWPDQIITKYCSILMKELVNDSRYSGATLLQIAASENFFNTMEALLESGVNIEETDDDENRALHYAAYSGNEKITQRLLAENAEINARNVQNETPLNTAAYSGHVAISRVLIKRGADIHNQSSQIGSVLQCGAISGNHALVVLLLCEGADVNAQGGEHGNALQAAALSDNEIIVRLLLEHGAEINAQGGFYGTALQAASYRGYEVVVRLLLEHEANVNAQGGKYGNALQAAAASYHGEEIVVRLLLEYGAEVNAQGGEFGNALQAASIQSNDSIVKLLLENGAVWTEPRLGSESGSCDDTESSSISESDLHDDTI